MKWLVKVKRYDSGTSIVSYWDSEKEAADEASFWNNEYQTDNYSSEKFDPALALATKAAVALLADRVTGATKRIKEDKRFLDD